MKKASYIFLTALFLLLSQSAKATPLINLDELHLTVIQGDMMNLSSEMLEAMYYNRSANQDEREICDGQSSADEDGNGNPDNDNDGDGYLSCVPTENYSNYAEFWAYEEAHATFDSSIDCRDNNPDINPGATEVCDGKDNNCDGVIDNDDPGIYCTEVDHANEEECEDDNGDEIDCAEKFCSDGIDQDKDDDIDCDDTDCAGTDACTESGVDEQETADSTDDKDIDECSDGNDDDHDGLIDCDDDDCATDPACLEQDTECGNGDDDDGDELIDCEDPDCAGSEACIETGSAECSNGDDDDDDGLFDCDDPDCADESVCEPDNIDDDGDGFTENQGDDDDTNPKLWFTAGSLSVDNDGDGYSENEGDCDDTSTAFSPAVDEICDDENNRDENCDGQYLTHEDFGKSSSFDMSAVKYLEDDETGLKCISAEYVPLATISNESPIPISCSFHAD